jgi:hypothetical protein
MIPESEKPPPPVEPGVRGYFFSSIEKAVVFDFSTMFKLLFIHVCCTV